MMLIEKKWNFCFVLTNILEQIVKMTDEVRCLIIIESSPDVL